jgi:lysozyme
MNFIDIASHQKGINLDYLFKNNPLDGVIVKATGGTSYLNPEYKGWAEWLHNNKKPMGFYHYCRELIGNPGTPEAEAQYFYKMVKPYVGEAVFFADFEANNSDALIKGVGW